MSDEIKDFFLNSIPSKISENDIKRALNLYHIGVKRITIRERLDHTRFAFLTVNTYQEFQELQQLGELPINGSAIRISVSRDRSKEDEEKHHKARIAVLISQASELDIDLAKILHTPTTSVYYCTSNELSQRSCTVFHKVKEDVEQVKLATSLQVDPMTNEINDIYQVDKDPLVGAKFDDVNQDQTKLEDIDSFYCTPDRISENLLQSFDVSREDISRIIEPPEPIDLDTTNTMLRSLHLARSERHGNGRTSGRSHRPSEESVESWHTPNSSTSNSRVGSQLDSFFTPTFMTSSSGRNVSTPTVQPTPMSLPTQLPDRTPQVEPINRNSQDRECTKTQPHALNTPHVRNTPQQSLSQHSSSRSCTVPLPHQGEAPTAQHEQSDPSPPRPQSSAPAMPQQSTPRLVLRPHKRKPDVPYSFRYFCTTEELDNWFQDDCGENPSHLEPASTCPTDSPNVAVGTDNESSLYNTGRCGVRDTNEHDSLPEQMALLDHMADEFNRANLVPAADTNEVDSLDTTDTDDTTDDTSQVITEALQLLIVFREDVNGMIANQDFGELGGIILQVTQIFVTLSDHGLLSSSILDRDTGVIHQAIKETQEEISDIEVVIGELSEAEEDLIQEITDSTLAEKLLQLQEQKADLLDLQMANVIEFDMTMDRLSVPDIEE